ncbi:MAG: D-amino acid aminotransferase [Rhodospirillaceae bacterium TMED8]|nr:D-amino acid aminotransferase [Magnetovibrio sp.]OUT52022.1 MAG: D-amino acid aminotransferase [Rhodospirillaceae bacterium TMED8]|tara:strand:- start:2257 stop:3138 length:882 start_codon:yes stop_codon:yes gene_type:complete
MSKIAYVNGQYLSHSLAKVHIEDRGYQFADGVYEVIAIHEGKFLGEKGHLNRLAHSLEALRIDWPMDKRPLSMVMREVRRRNRVRNGLLYLQITRGVAPRDHAFPNPSVSTLVITVTKRPAIDKAELLAGIEIITTPDLRWKRRDIKSISLLPNVLAKQAAIEAGAQEAWQVDEKGFVTEGSATNAWIVTKSGELITRDAGEEILNGITRLAILEAVQDQDIKLLYRPFSVTEARDAREAFISSSNSHVRAVTKIDGKAIGNGLAGELTRRLLDIYMEFMEGEGGPQQEARWN